MFFIAIICGACIQAQELPPIQNYTANDYDAENQNWSISQSQEKLIYVANNKGLLQFNGAAWTLYPSPNESIMRSVKVVGGRIYSGFYMEFGFWQKDDFDVLQYTSLSQKITTQLIEDEEFWNIIDFDQWIVFQSFYRIYIYNVTDESVRTIDSNNTITKIYKVGQNVYFQALNEGLFKLEQGNGILVSDDEILRNNEIVAIFKDDNDLLIVTRDSGFYRLANKLLTKWNVSANDLLSGVSIYSAIQLKDHSLVLGTIAHGILCLDPKGNVVYQIDQNKGLLNNTVLSLFEDTDNTIWLGLDNGISYLNIKSSLRIYNDHKGILGSVYASAVYRGILYLGTNQGLFYKELKTNNPFRFIEGTQGQVWCLKEIGQTLFCGHHAGTFVIEDDQAKKISNIAGTWNFKRLENNSNRILQGNYSGLYLLEKKDNNWQLRNKINGFTNSSRYFEIVGNDVFVNHEYKGVFRIKVDSSFSETKTVVIDSSIKGSNSGLIKYNDEVLYAYKKGIFKYDPKSRKFSADTVLSSLYREDEYVSGKLLVDEKNDRLCVFTDSEIRFLSRGKLAKTPRVTSLPLTKEERNSITGYESVMSLDNTNTYILGTSSGYMTFTIEKMNNKDFMVHLGSIENGSNKKNKAAIRPANKNAKGDFESTENNLKISFYAPEYNKYFKPKYQYRLVGMYDNWSDWTEEPSAFFENLPSGEYTFNVRAKVGKKVSANVAGYSFTIAKPWYITNVMILAYAFAMILFSFFMHQMYKRYYKKKQLELIEKNRRIIQLTKIQNEKEIIRIKNEQLQKEFEGKSKELATKTIDIAKKNELLTQLKSHLIQFSDQEAIKPVLGIINNNLDHHDNWELFKEAFANVDRKFLKKLKKTHPDLSPNDLKLCAYLRLNLSSKEIAPLFNISVRSVEIKRYRLRKKLNLQHEENLASYILEL